MSRARGVIADVAGIVLPWQPRSSRSAELDRARAARIRAEAALDKTLSEIDALHDIVYKGNHFADGISRKLRQSYNNGG
jgi:hypothetical protein